MPEDAGQPLRVERCGRIFGRVLRQRRRSDANSLSCSLGEVDRASDSPKVHEPEYRDEIEKVLVERLNGEVVCDQRIDEGIGFVGFQTKIAIEDGSAAFQGLEVERAVELNAGSTGKLPGTSLALRSSRSIPTLSTPLVTVPLASRIDSISVTGSSLPPCGVAPKAPLCPAALAAPFVAIRPPTTKPLPSTSALRVVIHSTPPSHPFEQRNVSASELFHGESAFTNQVKQAAQRNVFP